MTFQTFASLWVGALPERDLCSLAEVSRLLLKSEVSWNGKQRAIDSRNLWALASLLFAEISNVIVMSLCARQ